MYDSYHQHSASSSTSSRGGAPPAPTSSSSTTQVTAASIGGQGPATVQQQQQQFAQEFWEEQIVAAEQFDSDFKNHPLPLARIKKVMKSDPEVKMISAEAPILFSKACEIFICEITRRAWLHAEENKRRTLQRSDVASAVSRSDQFDFLIDIVPREEPPKMSKRSSTREDPAPEPEVYDEQQQQQYAQYYPQGPGGLAGYSHAIDPQFYQAVSHDQFQQYMQYQQAYAQQAPTSASAPSHSRNASAGYAQEATSRQS
ncbi:hypothetical protein BGX21_011536 [Mortierella sp. AD011]|nr:hypothetical protein BGX20_009461 [Mortierella sp. AD010]KAF9390162.1 hypothetical protein BGX21_011536 [Mortierella sp. AD011]